LIWEILSLLLSLVASLVGVVGCIVPVLPGPIIALAAPLAISLVGSWEIFRPLTLVILAVVAVATTVGDSILPARSASKAGAGRPGVVGSVVGMLVGSFLFPPFGTIIGAFAGALLGEVVFNRENRDPVRAALGVFRGTLLATLLKLASVGATAAVSVRGAITLLQ
jgi:hypothetical protein